MSEEVRNDLRDYILRTFLFTTDVTALNFDDSLLESGVLDSNGMMEIILHIEEKLGIAMREDEMIPENLDSVSRIAAFVARKKQSARADDAA